jgi:octaprenyl-diphosphate synthase
MPTRNNLKSAGHKADKFQISNFKFIDKELQQVRDLIERQLKVTGRDEAVKKLFLNFDICSGKMIRPALLLLSALACGKINERHIRVAAIIEMLHNATLLHDDVIDDGKLRRDRPTINSLFGNEHAILLGDFLLGRLFKLSARLEPGIFSFIASTAARICDGELRQTLHKNNWLITETDYLDMITDKSAALFSDCCFLGAVLAGAAEKEKRALSSFGLDFGIAFQLADDLFDIVGDEHKSGKTLGSDVNENKPTLALIYLLSKISWPRKNKLISRLNAGLVNKNSLLKLIESESAAGYVRSRITWFTDKAVVKLRPLKDSPAKKALIETAHFFARSAQ